jgi:hypothetical protein
MGEDFWDFQSLILLQSLSEASEWVL